MDAQHQKTNKSAQFACYLRTYIHHRVLHPTFIFSRCCFPPSSICSSYTAHSSRTTRQASKQQREGERFWGRLFFLFFWSRKQKDTTRTTYLPYLPRSLQTGDCEPPNRELRLGKQTTMCDYTKVEYACYHLRYTVRAWCKSTYLSSHPFPFSFSFFLFLFSSFFFFLFIHISQCPRHGWRFRYVCF